jgi:PknH-like extracellular domain
VTSLKRKEYSLPTRLAAAVALVAIATACGSNDRKPPPLVPASALDNMLLNPDDINKIMGAALVPNPPFTAFVDDDRYLVPNLNCLGIVQVGERAIYGDSKFTAVRGQQLRQPDTDLWDSLVVQAAVIYASPDAAKAFFAASSDRWSKCTNHRVNITLNDQPKVTWFFGNLTKTDTSLTMPVTRGQNERSCDRMLSVANNVIVDVRACGHAITNQATAIAQKITERIPH